METKYYDNHTIFLNCKHYTVEEIEESLIAALKQYGQIDCKFHINLMTNKDGVSFGKAFVYISNPAVYHMILGRNLDGSERIELIDDPNWVAPVASPARSRSNSKEQKINILEADWAELIEREEEKERLSLKYVCPKIPIQLNSLITLPDDIGCEANYVMRIDPNLASHILKTVKLPAVITRDHIKQKFFPFASDCITLHSRRIKGKLVQENYPFVTITRDRTVYIIFDPNTRDAQFALNMTKKTVIKNNTLYFAHARKSDNF